jgi:geranylgeranylglycerol-phosphate geranylgeranyltransferase
MSRLSAYMMITRPGNVIIAMVSVMIAVSLTGRFYPVTHIILAVLSTGLITAGANIINDYYDIETDKINRPMRPLPSGKMKRKAALIFFCVVYITAFLLALFISIYMFLIAFIVGLLLFFYSYHLKRTVLWGNLVVSLSTALAFIYGGLAVGVVSAVIYPAIFAFLLHFGREIIKDMEDVEGDQRTGAKTLAVVYGYKSGYILSISIFIVLIILMLIPYIYQVYGNLYLLIIAIGIYPVLLYIIIQLRKKPEKRELGKISTLLKIEMIIGLLAIYLG